MPPSMPVAERNRSSAKALVQNFRELKFSERQKALLPCSMADSAQEELPSLDDDSFLSMRAKWQHPVENLTLHLVLKPLDLHVNSIIIPSLLAWAGTVSDAVSGVLSKRGAVPVAPRAYFDKNEAISACPITLARLVIEPIIIRLATKAPPPPLESSALRRLIDWLVGTESMSGLTLESGRISFAGVFQDANALFRRTRDEYRKSLLSRSVARQLLVQISTVSNLARVGAATFLRGNRIGVIQPQSTLPNISSTTKEHLHVSGLAQLLDELEEQSGRRRLGFGNHLQITSGVVTRLQPHTSIIHGAVSSDEVEVLNLVP